MGKKTIRTRAVSGERTEAVQVEVREGKVTKPVKDSVTKKRVDGIQELLHVAKVRVGGSVTKNMGDYNSVRVSVEIEMPCAPDRDSVDAMYVMLSEDVEAKIDEEINVADSRF